MRRLGCFTVPVCALMALSTLLIGGCGEDPAKPSDEEPTGYPVATTVSRLLSNFQLAHEEMNLKEYGRLLHDDFTFVFDPRDVGPDKPWQDETWGRTEDLASTERMFGGQPNLNGLVVDHIRLSFQWGQPETSPENGAWQMVLLTAVDLTMNATEEQTGDEWIIQIPGGYEARLHLVPTAPDGGAIVWKIIRWEDKPPQGLRAPGATEQSSWGAIKALYL